MNDLSHIDETGRARMVDVSEKTETNRCAKAEAVLRITPALYEQISSNSLKKGDALRVARIAGIQAAKKTSDLIPLCHPLPLSYINVVIDMNPPDVVHIHSEVKNQAKTGVEMEALTAVSVAALTVYDMGKAVDKGIVIEKIQLLEKSGGESGLWKRSSAE